MSTRAIFLPESAVFPLTNFPALLQDAQSRMHLAFDATTNESAFWTFVAPQGLSGALTLVLTYRAASATAGTAIFDAAIEAITAGDAVVTSTASSFDVDNVSSAATVPGIAGHIGQISITLTNADAIAIADLCRLRINRDNLDTAVGDIHLLAAELRDAA